MGTYQVLPVVVPFHPQKDEIKTPYQFSDLITTQFDLDLGNLKFQCPQVLIFLMNYGTVVNPGVYLASCEDIT